MELRRRGGPQSVRSGDVHRRLTRLGVWTVGLLAASQTANAHGAFGHGGTSVAFALVVALPVVAGLVGGAFVVRRRRGDRPTAGAGVGMPLAFLLVALGVTFALGAMIQRLSLGIAGCAIGGFAALLATGRWEVFDHRCDAEIALGAVSLHRLFEGLVIGALYATGAAVGLVGALVVTGHTALETAAVGGFRRRKRDSVPARIAVVQLCYAIGAVVGLGVATAVPSSIQVAALALSGGALLGLGAVEVERPLRSYQARIPR